MSTYEERVRAALPEVRERIAAALERSGRNHDVAIVAVTKTHPVEAVHAALAAGLGDCGENRVQELESKVEAAGRIVRWHLIGHLQRNKAKTAVQLFDLMHSLDSIVLARVLDREAEKAGRVVRALMQVNASGEETKGGFDVAEAVDAAGTLMELKHVRVEGLMTMAPYTDDEQVLRATFSRTRAALEACRAAGLVTGTELSMGMSNDYAIAVEEGATLVRLGTVLFGERG